MPILYGCDTGTTASTTAIWYAWSSAVSTATTSTDSVWYYWANGTTSTNCEYTAGPWRLWNAVSRIAAEVQRESDEQRAARIAAEEQRRRQLEEERKARQEREAAANKKAEETLRENLNEEQRKEYDQTRSFHVIGADGERYQVRRAWAGHVSRVDREGRSLENYCIHPNEQVPLPDNQLIAKLMLEHDIERFKKTANMTPVRRAAAV